MPFREQIIIDLIFFPSPNAFETCLDSESGAEPERRVTAAAADLEANTQFLTRMKTCNHKAGPLLTHGEADTARTASDLEFKWFGQRRLRSQPSTAGPPVTVAAGPAAVTSPGLPYIRAAGSTQVELLLSVLPVIRPGNHGLQVTWKFKLRLPPVGAGSRWRTRRTEDGPGPLARRHGLET